MIMFSSFISLFLLSLLSQSAGQQDDQNQEAAANQTPELPQVWGEQQYVNEISGGFRIFSQVQLTKSKATFLFDEWALGEQQLYRLDIIHKETGKRRTILANGQTKERYHYEPFVCSAIESLTGSLSPELSQLFPMLDEGHKFVLAGLGSIWLEASRRIKKSPKDSNTGQSQVLTFKAADPSADSKTIRLRKTARRILMGYDQFIVHHQGSSINPTPQGFAYNIVFYFHESSTLSGEISPESLVAISLVDPKSSQILMRAKIIEIETSNVALANIKAQKELFEMPLGYGCAKAERSADAGATRYVQPENLFTNSAHELNLEVSALLPNQLEHDVDKWQTHSSSFRLLAGHLLGRQYMVINKQEFSKLTSEQQEQKHRPRASHLNKLKRVWDLGPVSVSDNQIKPNNETTTNIIKETSSISNYYDIDEHSAECLNEGTGSKQGKLDQLPSVEFPLLASANKQINNGQESQLAGLTFDVKTLMKLFYETYGYYLVREEKGGWPNRKEIVYERRDDHFELKSPQTGEIVWEGPASFVRRSKILYDHQFAKPTTTQISPQDKRVTVTIHLYTKRYDQLVGQIKLSLLPGRLVDLAYLHRSLSIEPCLLPAGASSHLVRQPLKETNSISFQIDYQYQVDVGHELELELLAKEAKAEEIIYRKFLTNCVQITDKQVDLLQFEDILVSINKRSVSISGKVYEWPHLFEFHRSEGQRLSVSNEPKITILRELKQNEAKCAETCGYYHCQQFSYCNQDNVCSILMSDAASGDDDDTKQVGLPKSVDYSDDKQCALFTRRSDKHQSIKPVDFIHRVKRLILSESGDETNPMAIQFIVNSQSTDETSTLVIKLIPTYIEALNSAAATSLATNQANSGPINLDYEILMAGKKFKPLDELSENFPIREANHVSYANCESICEENDCRSFSYCQLEQTCLISRLHKTHSIEQNSVRQPSDSTCRIMALNYKSKFQLIKQNKSLKPKGFIKQLEVGTSRDCAIDCMEEPGFKCRSFWFCSSASDLERNFCFLRKIRGNQLSTYSDNNDFKITTATVNDESQQDSFIDCQLYLRSHLADFDHFYGKKLGSKFGGHNLLVKTDINAERCASECAEMEQSTCLAFHICQGGGAGSSSPTCTLFAKNPNQPAAVTINNETMITSGDLEDGPGCTTFLLPPNVGRKLALNVVSMDDLSEMEEEEGPTGIDQQATRSSWLIDLFMIGFGLLVGYLLTWLFVSFKRPSL